MQVKDFCGVYERERERWRGREKKRGRGGERDQMFRGDDRPKV